MGEIQLDRKGDRDLASGLDPDGLGQRDLELEVFGVSDDHLVIVAGQPDGRLPRIVQNQAENKGEPPGGRIDDSFFVKPDSRNRPLAEGRKRRQKTEQRRDLSFLHVLSAGMKEIFYHKSTERRFPV